MKAGGVQLGNLAVAIGTAGLRRCHHGMGCCVLLRGGIATVTAGATDHAMHHTGEFVVNEGVEEGGAARRRSAAILRRGRKGI